MELDSRKHLIKFTNRHVKLNGETVGWIVRGWNINRTRHTTRIHLEENLLSALICPPSRPGNDGPYFTSGANTGLSGLNPGITDTQEWPHPNTATLIGCMLRMGWKTLYPTRLRSEKGTMEGGHRHSGDQFLRLQHMLSHSHRIPQSKNFQEEVSPPDVRLLSREDIISEIWTLDAGATLGRSGNQVLGIHKIIPHPTVLAPPQWLQITIIDHCLNPHTPWAIGVQTQILQYHISWDTLTLRLLTSKFLRTIDKHA